MLSCPGFMVLVTWVKFLGEKLKVTIPLFITLVDWGGEGYEKREEYKMELLW